MTGTLVPFIPGFSVSTASISAGTGSPEGSKTAAVGSLYLRTDGGSGTSAYIKETGSGNTGWRAVGTSGSTVATDTLWDTKGDLAVATGADAAAKLSVGANNTVLTADSTQTTGVRWGTAAGATDGIPVYNVKRDFSATGDGSTDDKTAIQNAINAANSAGGGKVYFPMGVYRVSGTLTSFPKVHLIGDVGLSVIYPDDVAMTNGVINFGGTGATTNKVTTNTLPRNSRTLTFSTPGDGASFSVGDEVLILDDQTMPDVSGTPVAIYGRWITKIAAISGDTLTFQERSPLNFIGDGTPAITVRKVPGGVMQHDMVVYGLTFKCNTASSTGYAANLGAALRFHNSWGGLIERCQFYYFGAGGVYAAWINRCRNLMIRNCHFERNNLSIGIEESTGCSVIGNHFIQNGWGVAAQQSPLSLIALNEVHGTGMKAADTGATLTDIFGRSIKVSYASDFTKVHSNLITNSSPTGITFDNITYGEIVGNTIAGFRDQAINVFQYDGTANGTNNSDNLVANNTIYGGWAIIATEGNNSTGINMKCSYGRVIGNKISNTTGSGMIVGGTNPIVAENDIDTTGSNGPADAIVVQSTSSGGSYALNNIRSSSGTNSLNTGASGGSNKIGLNTVDKAYSLHASDYLFASDRNATALTYGVTVNTNAALSDYFTLGVTNGTAFTIALPTNLTAGVTLTYDIKNSSGGAMGAITWNGVFLLAGAFTNPANGKRRTITFNYDGTSLVEVSRAAADI